MTFIPQEPLDQFAHIDLIVLPTLILIIFNLLYSARKNTGALGPTISDMLAYHKGSHFIFSISMTVLYPLYYSFLWFWVGPTQSMPAVFYAILAFSAIAEMVFVWLPARDRTKLIHIVAASVVGVGMLLIALLILLFSEALGMVAQASIYAFLISTVCLGILTLLRTTRRHIFFYEVAYIVSFLATMSLVAHT